MYNENDIAGTLTSVVIEGGMGSICWLDVWQSKVARHKRRVIQAELGADLGDEQAPVPVFCKQQYLGVKCVGQVGGGGEVFRSCLFEFEGGSKEVDQECSGFCRSRNEWWYSMEDQRSSLGRY